jgi:selenocysteine lyase/cysteine desulfurase
MPACGRGICRRPADALDGIAWLRISARAYNELADFERLAEVISKELDNTCV